MSEVRVVVAVTDEETGDAAGVFPPSALHRRDFLALLVTMAAGLLVPVHDPVRVYSFLRRPGTPLFMGPSVSDGFHVPLRTGRLRQASIEYFSWELSQKANY